VSGLDAIASELDARAAQVESAGAQLVRAAEDAIWTSIAADAFRAQVGRRQGQCGHIAELLHAAASDVRRFADGVDAEKARLRRVAFAAETVATHAGHVLSGVEHALRRGGP
jgi:hypothetical protein